MIKVTTTASVLLLQAVLLPSVANALLHYQRLAVSNKRLGRYSPSTSITQQQTYAATTLQMRLNPTSFPGTNFIITEFPRPALRRTPNSNVVHFDAALVGVATEMIGVMYAANGVGLAAPQVGLNQNLFVYNPSADAALPTMERIVCNPVIRQYSEDIEVEQEGCLSLRSDDCAGQVARAAWIMVEYRNELGQKVTRRLKGFEARVFQHEYDHLQGVLCWDRFPPEDKDAVQANIEKLLSLYPESDALIELDSDIAKSMQPPRTTRLTASQMPPLDSMQDEVLVSKPKAKTGFGGGGSSNNKKSNSSKKKKKKGK